MEALGWRRRRGSSPAARRGARQRAGLTPASASNTLSCDRETLHRKKLRPIKKPLHSNHGIYRYTRNPMYLGHLIFMLGLALTFWSWFGLALFALRAAWFQHRVKGDEARLAATFGADYEAYRARVKRWVPGVI